jgi:HSP20 family protein
MTDLDHQGAADLAEDARRLLQELDRDVAGAGALTGECRPAIDVIEMASAIELVVDVPGMRAEWLRVVIRRNAVLVVGVKLTATAEPGARVHVAERSYGRFARVVRLQPAFDATRATAVAAAGQLRVVLPRQSERRGVLITVPVALA